PRSHACRQHFDRLMVGRHTVDDEDVAFGIVAAQGLDRCVSLAVIPVAGLLVVGKLEDNGIAFRQTALEVLDPAAMGDEAAAEGRKRRIDALQIFDNAGSEIDVPEISDSVGCHGSAPVAVRVSCDCRSTMPSVALSGAYASGNYFDFPREAHARSRLRINLAVYTRTCFADCADRRL